MRDKIIAYFKMLTAIDSPSGHEDELAERLEGILKGRSFAVNKDDTGNIIARRGQGNPLLLCCHMDTVESTQGLELKFDGDYITSSGETILGADDKAGIAVILGVLDNLDCDPALELFFSVQEETGMIGTRALKPGAFKAKSGLVLDAGEPIGAVITQAPGETDLEIFIYGRGAHAAANPEKGIDAIRLAARFIDQLPPARIAQGSTFNLGIIQGGKSTNTICPRVQIQGEIRSFDDTKRRDIAGELKDLLAKSLAGTGGDYKFASRELYLGYKVDSGHPLLKLLDKTAQAHKITVDQHPRFAGSDANSLNGLGVTTVNLGVGVEDNHSFQERVSVSAMVNMANWLNTILKEWSHARPES